MSIKFNISGQAEIKAALNKTVSIASKAMIKQLAIGALNIESDAKSSIQRGSRSGVIYKRGGISHQSSAAGQPPKTDRGGLVSSIRTDFESGGTRVKVGSNIEYSRALEFGNPKRKLQPRPWLFPAFEKNKNKIVKSIEKTIRQSVIKITPKKK